MTTASATLPSRVTIREVGPRDGLQGERPVSPADRVELALALVGAGCRRIEAASFVSEKAVPAMAGASDVVGMLRRRLVGLGLSGEVAITALVPNVRGALSAIEAEVDELSVTVAASPGYNERNVRRSIDDSVREIAEVASLAEEAGLRVDAVVSCAFGSPYEDEISPAFVAALAERLVQGGCSELTLADTTGVGDPLSIGLVLDEVSSSLPGISPGLHLHETRGTSLVNAYAAMQLGVSRFDTSIGGLGGSPFAKGAGGNLATEDFVSFLDALGIATQIELDRLLPAARLAETLVGHELKSKLSQESS